MSNPEVMRQALRKIADIAAVGGEGRETATPRPQHITARRLLRVYDIALFALAEDERKERDVSATG